jgi:hypothetical protein
MAQEQSPATVPGVFFAEFKRGHDLRLIPPQDHPAQLRENSSGVGAQSAQSHHRIATLESCISLGFSIFSR